MAISDGLYRMRRLLELLGNPEKSFRAIHIAGTNGKGSTAVFTASVLEQAGYSVGLYTSPHLELVNERVQLWDGEHHMISDKELEVLGARVDLAAAKLKAETNPETGQECGDLHYFERITAIGYLYFADKNPDYVVLECGLGGRLDSTNTLDKPLVSVITHIALDHTQELGRTIFKVIREKAGIIKPGVPVVSQSEELATQQIISQVAAENGSSYADASLVRDDFAGYELGMKGAYQINNAATAVTAIRAAGIEISEDAIINGLKKAVLPGRFEVLREKPYWIIDGAHNPDAMEASLEAFNMYKREKKFGKTLIVFGCMQDKNYFGMVQLMNQLLKKCDYATVHYGSDRCKDPEALAELLADCGHGCMIYDSVDEAYEDISGQNYECVLTIGSIYLAGAMRNKIL